MPAPAAASRSSAEGSDDDAAAAATADAGVMLKFLRVRWWAAILTPGIVNCW